MIDALVQAMQLVGSLMAVTAAATAVVWYIVAWPFDRGLRFS